MNAESVGNRIEIRTMVDRFLMNTILSQDNGKRERASSSLGDRNRILLNCVSNVLSSTNTTGKKGTSMSR